MMYARSLVLLLIAAITALPAYSMELVQNGGLELPGYVTGPGYRFLGNGDSTTVLGWTAIDDGIGEAPYMMRLPEYNNVIAGKYSVSLNQGSGIFTHISLQTGVQYTLTFETKRVSTNELAPLQVTIGNISETFSPLTNVHEYRFISSISDPTALLKFYNPSPVGDYKIYVLDSVSVSAVPEGSALAHLLVGVPTLLGLQRRIAGRARRTPRTEA